MIDGIIFDLDGVIWRSHDVVPGAVATLDHLADRGISVAFATNHTVHTAPQVAAKFTRLGFSVASSAIVTAGDAVVSLLKARGSERVHLVGEGGIIEQITDAGITLTHDNPDHVVVAFDRTCTYETLRAATRAVIAGASLVVSGADRRIPTAAGFEMGMGALGSAVAYAAGVEPLYAGKPHSPIIELALERLGTPAAATLIVGDTLETDIAAAAFNGLAGSVVVLTGNTDADAAATARGEQAPSHVIPSVASLPDLLAALMGA